MFAATPAHAHANPDDIAWADAGKYMCSNESHPDKGGGACIYARAYGDYFRLCDTHADGKYAWAKIGHAERRWDYKIDTRGLSSGECDWEGHPSGHDVPEHKIYVRVCVAHDGNVIRHSCAEDNFQMAQ